MKLKRLAGVMLLLALGAEHPAGAASPFDWPEHLEWNAEFRGVDSTSVTLTEPRPLRVHAMRIDLAAPGVSVCTNRDNGDRAEETDGYKTSSFLRRRGCQLAINGAPFWPGVKYEGTPQNVVGLVVEKGVLVSPVDSGEKARAALVFRGDRATIEWPPIDLEGIDTAVGGFGVVLERGQPVRDETSPPGVLDGRHPRTAVGASSNGRVLYLVAVDGRQEGYSEGVDLAELGELMGLLGATEAMNLDGGGTTSMAIEGEDGEPRLVNRPIDGGVPGQERVGANHLGVYAERALADVAQ